MSRRHLLPEPSPALDVDQAVYLATREYRGGQKALAYTIAIDPGTLQKKVSIANTTHHLTLPEFLAVADAVDDPRIDEAYARARGLVMFKVAPVGATADALAALADKAGSAADFARSLSDGVADSVWERHEVERLAHHGYELIASVLGIIAGAREVMGEQNHG